jgi:hypothetical protein
MCTLSTSRNCGSTVLWPDAHAVFNVDQTGLSTALTVDLDQTVKAMANHAVGQSRRTADWRPAKGPNAGSQQASGDCFAPARRDGAAVEVDGACVPERHDRDEHDQA